MKWVSPKFTKLISYKQCAGLLYMGRTKAWENTQFLAHTKLIGGNGADIISSQYITLPYEEEEVEQ